MQDLKSVGNIQTSVTLTQPRLYGQGSEFVMSPCSDCDGKAYHLVLREQGLGRGRFLGSVHPHCYRTNSYCLL